MKFSLFFLPIWTLALSACQTPSGVSDDFRAAESQIHHLKAVKQTSVVFLVDGFSATMMKTALSAGNMPHIEQYFHLPKSGGFRLARASFPSLTYPNLTSILTGQTVNQHTVTGNRVIIDDESYNFEDFYAWSTLDHVVRERTVFHHLTKADETSVSFSYPFPRGSTAHREENLDAGVNYALKDFNLVDQDILLSLRILLKDVDIDKWPRFIFVHLIGVDATAHQFGPETSAVQNYIRELDSHLEKVFALLNEAEAHGHGVQIVLTADHGFVPTNYKVIVDAEVAKLDKKIRVVNDNRVASLYFPSTVKAQDRMALNEQLLHLPHVSATAQKEPGQIDLRYSTGRRARIDFTPAPCPIDGWSARFQWIEDKPTEKMLGDAPSTPEPAFFCTHEFDRTGVNIDDSFIVPALVDYFAAPSSPDLIVLPDDQSDFTGEYKGNHGGLTRAEMLVPLLTKDVVIPDQMIPTAHLLELMGLPHGSH